MDLLDGFRHIAKVRVASSNLVIRSREVPGERPFRGPLVASALTDDGPGKGVLQTSMKRNTGESHVTLHYDGRTDVGKRHALDALDSRR